MTDYEKLAEKYFLEKDFNCAESTLRIACERLNFDLDENALKLVSGYGGGFGCGKTCGALCGAISAISEKTVAERAHVTANFKNICSEFVNRFEKEFGSCDCAQIKPLYFVEGKRCVSVVAKTSEMLDSYLAEIGENNDGK